MVLEICVDSLESALTAAKGGADRLELCSDLLEGGITPSFGLMQAVRARVAIDVYVMIRPRGGDSLYSDDEFQILAADICEARRLGVDGVVLGMLTADGNVDIPRTEQLVKLAHPMKVTFHRAIDMTVDMARACQDVIVAGAHRVLTSGGRQTALEGAEQIAQLVDIADGSIAIMAGSGINADNVAQLARVSRVREFHASLRRPVSSLMGYRNEEVRLGAPKVDEFVRYTVREQDVVALREALDSLERETIADRRMQ